MRKCPNCGKENPLDAIFCGYCGEKYPPETHNDAEEQRSLKDLISKIKWKYVPLFESWTSSTSDETNPPYYSWEETKKDLQNFLLMVERVKRLFPKAEGKIEVYLNNVRGQMETIELKVEFCENTKDSFMQAEHDLHEATLEWIDEGLNSEDKKRVEFLENHADWWWGQLKEADLSYKKEIIKLRRILLDLCDYVTSIEKSI